MKSLEEKEQARQERIDRNKGFLGLDVSEQAKKIRASKHYRYKNKRLPLWAEGIDLSDPKEVKKWENIEFYQRFPFLRKDKPVEVTHADVFMQDGSILHAQVIYDVIQDEDFIVAHTYIIQTDWVMDDEMGKRTPEISDGREIVISYQDGKWKEE